MPAPTAVDRRPVPAGPVDRPRRHRRFALVAAGQVRLLALLASSGGTSPLAVLPFLALCVVLACWRGSCSVGSGAASATCAPWSCRSTPGQARSRARPSAMPPTARHLSLSGDVEPPTRW